MLIEFQKSKFKNFLGVGNFLQEINYATAKNTMVTGKNGSGKSAIMLDVITYALFGKGNREVKVAQLINSRNGKDCVVELTFKIGNDLYRVVRGQKPDIFEIYKNEVLIPQLGNKNDYQSMLERHILRMNLKTFKQVVIIGSAAYKPLMQLDAAERRGVTEDVLDITIYTDMNKKAKEKVKSINTEVKSLTSEISMRKEQERTQKEMIESMEQEAKDRKKRAKKEREQRIVTIQNELEDSSTALEELTIQLGELDNASESSQYKQKISELRENRSKLTKKSGKLESDIETDEENIEFFQQESCPTCHQPITEDHRHSMISTAEEEIGKARKQLDQTNSLIEQFDAKIKCQTEKMEEAAKKEQTRRDIEAEIRTVNRDIKRLTADLTEAQEVEEEEDTGPAIKEAKKKYKANLTTLLELTDKKSELQRKVQYYEMSSMMLGDSGAKAQAIDEVLPTINTLINKYLKQFDMFVNFELTNTFDEIIKARHRDTFSYNSFSEGQKRRIDHSILFAFREIAMMKGSISCNIVVFDEILEKNLDDEGKEVLQQIIAQIDPSIHVFVVSPIAFTPEFFDRVLTIEYPNEFTKIVEHTR